MKRALLALALGIFLSACATATGPSKISDLAAPHKVGIEGTPPVRTTAKGVVCIEVQEGSGAPAARGQRVFVEYTGTLEDGSVFDTSKGQKAFSFRIGSRTVITGWDDGVAGMKVGGKRRLIIPPALAYGEKGVPDKIPPNATLIFDIELFAILQ